MTTFLGVFEALFSVVVTPLSLMEGYYRCTGTSRCNTFKSSMSRWQNTAYQCLYVAFFHLNSSCLVKTKVMSYLSEDHVTDDCMLRKLDGTAIKGRIKRLYKDLLANRITISRIGNPPESERGRPATNATTTDCPRSAGSSDRSVLAMQTMGTF